MSQAESDWDSTNWSDYGLSMNCSDDDCLPDEDYLVDIEKYIFPAPYEWVLIALHFVVFCVGLAGNTLVCAAVYRNHSMRTVTNLFIVNLAIADFLVILLCLPSTVLWDVTETWFMGSTLCKVVLYFQTVSVSVSVLTLTFISLDRWYAICFPLKFKSTIGRAKSAIAVIWIISLLIDIPELVVLDTRPNPHLRVRTIYLTECVATWGDTADAAYQGVKFTLLYALPLLFMSLTYYHIIRVLWRSGQVVFTRRRTTDPLDDRQTSVSLIPLNKSGVCINYNSAVEMQLRSRRKAAKMLVVVVVVFTVCYFPVHLINLLRYIIKIPQNDFTVTVALISHWLCYFNSAINPVIYNFMSGKFRKEFRRGLRCFASRPSSPDAQLRRGRPRLAAVIQGTAGAALGATLGPDALQATYENVRQASGNFAQNSTDNDVRRSRTITSFFRSRQTSARS